MAAVTTKSGAMKVVWVKFALGIVFAALGAWVVYLAVDMVGIFGEGMGVDERSRTIYSRAHIAVHLFGATSSVAVSLFLMGRHKLLAIFATLAILLCGGYGIVNMIGFTTTNRLVVAEVKTAANNADERQYLAARGDLEKSIDWAQKSAAQEEGREKRRLLTYIDEKRKELSALKPPKPTAATVLADPQATWFARFFNSASEKGWQLALPVPVAFLLFAAEVLSFVFAAHLIVGAVEDWRIAALAATVARNRFRGDDPPGGGSSRRDETEKPSTATVASVPQVAAKLNASTQRSANVVTFGAPKSSALLLTPEDKGFRYVQEQIARLGSAPSQLALARVMGVSPATASRTVDKWEEQGHFQRKRRGKCNEIVRSKGNGGSALHALASG